VLDRGLTLKYTKNLEFGLTLILLLATAILSSVAYITWQRLTFFVGSYLFIHWLGLIATMFIAITIPIHYILKRKRPQNSKIILKIHVIGNLFAYLLISLHFAQNFGRLAGALQRLGTGFALYLLLSLIVATGILERYRINGKLARYFKVLHKYTVIVLYLLILIHLLEGFNIL
jgi:hypothetical protein